MGNESDESMTPSPTDEDVKAAEAYFLQRFHTRGLLNDDAKSVELLAAAFSAVREAERQAIASYLRETHGEDTLADEVLAGKHNPNPPRKESDRDA